MVNSSDTIHIPAAIRFECSGCGNCCLQWPVPATQQDVERIQALVPDNPASGAESSDLDKALHAFLRQYRSGAGGFRPLSVGDQRYRGFTHVLEKRSDGRCQFLTEDNACALHAQFGAQSKPSMCRLFPYAFSKTPSGVFAYVSFASSGVLLNHGRLLTEQQELLADKLALYNQLFPNNNPDWSRLQILDGHALDWERFLDIDLKMLRVLEPEAGPSILERLEECSRIACQALPANADPERLPPMDTPPFMVDRILLKHLAAAYLPADVFKDEELEFPVQELMQDLLAPAAVSQRLSEFRMLANLKLGELDSQSEDLLRRFAYSRLFAKLYLGPNLAHFSLIAGLHHLYFVVALVRFKVKLMKREGQAVGFAEVSETLRVIERRLCQFNFTPQSGAVLEVLFSSPARLQRVRQLVL